MKIICVDDEELLVEDAVATCLELPQIDEAIGFSIIRRILRCWILICPL